MKKPIIKCLVTGIDYRISEAIASDSNVELYLCNTGQALWQYLVRDTDTGKISVTGPPYLSKGLALLSVDEVKSNWGFPKQANEINTDKLHQNDVNSNHYGY